MIRSLRVFEDGRSIGQLREARTNKFTFTYEPDVQPESLVSVRLPVDEDRYSPAHVAGWLAGLLADEDARAHLAEVHDFAPHFDLRVLEAIGSDLPGALVFLGEDDDPLPPGPPTGTPVDLELALHLGEVGVVNVDGQWCAPDQGTPSTHWLRPEDPMLPGAVVAEAFGLAVASELGLAVMEPTIDLIDGVPVLVVARPDRSLEDGLVLRHHMEHMGQVCGIDTARNPDAIYEEADGPGFIDVAEQLLEVSAEPRADLEQLVRLMTAGLVIGNGNAHAGMMPFLLPERRLGPVHSMLSTEWFTEVETEEGVLELDHRLAMSVNDIWKSDGVDHEDLVMEATRWPTLGRVMVQPWIDELLAEVPNAVERASTRISDVPSSLGDFVIDRANALSRG